MALIVRICSTTVAMPVLLNVCRKFLVRCSDVGVLAAVFGHHGPCSRARCTTPTVHLAAMRVGRGTSSRGPVGSHHVLPGPFFLLFMTRRETSAARRAAGQARGGYCPYSCPLETRGPAAARAALRVSCGQRTRIHACSFLRLRLIRYRRLNNVHMVSTGQTGPENP